MRPSNATSTAFDGLRWPGKGPGQAGEPLSDEETPLDPGVCPGQAGFQSVELGGFEPRPTRKGSSRSTEQKGLGCDPSLACVDGLGSAEFQRFQQVEFSADGVVMDGRWRSAAVPESEAKPRQGRGNRGRSEAPDLPGTRTTDKPRHDPGSTLWVGHRCLT